MQSSQVGNTKNVVKKSSPGQFHRGGTGGGVVLHTPIVGYGVTLQESKNGFLLQSASIF